MKATTLSDIKKQWSEIKCFPIFEVEVLDTRTNEKDYITFDVTISGRKLRAEHVGLTEKQEKSNKIAFCEVIIDPDFSLDENLQELYSECMNALNESEFFEQID